MLTYVIGHWWQVSIVIFTPIVLSEMRIINTYSRETALFALSSGLSGVLFAVVFYYVLLQPALALEVAEAKTEFVMRGALDCGDACGRFASAGGCLAAGLAVFGLLRYAAMVWRERGRHIRVWG